MYLLGFDEAAATLGGLGWLATPPVAFPLRKLLLLRDCSYFNRSRSYYSADVFVCNPAFNRPNVSEFSLER